MPRLEPRHWKEDYLEYQLQQENLTSTQELCSQSLYDELVKTAEYHMKENDFQEAIDLLQEATYFNQADEEVFISLGQCHMELQNFTEAALVFKKLTEIKESDIGFILLATAYYQGGEDFRALEAYLRALAYADSEAPFLFDIYKNLGNIFLRIGDICAAEENFNKALRIHPESDVLYVNYGTLEIQKNNFEQALKCFRTSLELNSENERAWIGLSLIHQNYGDLDLSWANLERALQINLDNSVALHLILDRGVKEGRISELINLCDKKMCNGSADVEFCIRYIETLLSIGFHKKAKEVLNQSQDLEIDKERLQPLKELVIKTMD